MTYIGGHHSTIAPIFSGLIPGGAETCEAPASSLPRVSPTIGVGADNQALRERPPTAGSHVSFRSQERLRK